MERGKESLWVQQMERNLRKCEPEAATICDGSNEIAGSPVVGSTIWL